MLSGTVTSPALGMRVASLRARMQAAEITEHELMAFQKVVAIMEDGLGRIDGDDLIAASFVDNLSPENAADHADI
ncbi:hypothetical protein FJ543_23050 [Mesorhizobium sp. B2-5-7]|nr:hypothetical protein [Mesorhizobium sp. B2-5-7]MBZ9974105.1 hypothetical protein [Mesorhizobium sp. BR-1-1-10]TPK10550.1 hypothetical protein FJ543_23050 [Mesorhizobium sp. B2-5-7]